MSEQISLLETSDIIAGFEGSAFHTLLFSSQPKAKLLHFKRGLVANENYRMLAEACGFQAEFYDFFVKYGESAGKAVHLQNVLQDLSKIWDVLYRQKLVKNREYTDRYLECKLNELDNQSKKDYPNQFKKQ